MKQIFAKLFFWTFFIASSTLVANAESISVKAMDTIAGYSSTLSSQKMAPETNVNFRVEKPGGGVIYLAGRSNAEGYAQTDIDGYHTKTAGKYFVSLAKESKDFGGSSTFEIFPDIFSAQKSKISSSQTSIAAGEERLVIRVHIKDKYENPITGHLIQLVSSRSEDGIQPRDNGITNDNGIASFEVHSPKDGVSVFSAIDMNVSQAIDERKKIIFYSPDENFAIGGDLFAADLTSSPTASSNSENFGVLDHFDIEFPQEVEANDDQNFLKLSAKDKDGNTVRSYIGTVKIAVLGDDNAILPSEGEYSFSERDQGEKEFALAMIFTTTGNKTIQVYDFEDGEINPTLNGEKVVEVVEKREQDIQNNDGAITQDIVIKSPINSSELSASTLTVSGLAIPNTNLKLMLDDVKVADVSVDLEGFFSNTLEDIEDGRHGIYVIETEGQRRASETVSFKIDATSARIDTISLFPEAEIYPENSYTITLYSEAGLDSAKVLIAGTEEKLIESKVSPGKYEGSFFAPKNPGKYNIDVLLVDSLGNEGNYKNQLSLEVVEKIVVKPGKPQNLLATAGDTKVDLSWKAPVSEKNIDHYNIYVGQNASTLVPFMQSRSVSALLQNLENSTEYALAVTAIDIAGEEGEKSDVIRVKPAKPVFVPVKEDPVEEVVHSVAPKKNPLRSISGDKKVTLSWEAFPEAEKYEIIFGIRSKQYEIKQRTSDNITSYVVNDLLNDLPYYFTVRALDENGFTISENYPEIRSIPNGSGFSIIPSKKVIPENIIHDFSKEEKVRGNTGPETMVLMLIAFVIAVIAYISKRRAFALPSISSSVLNFEDDRVEEKRKMQF
ncbi:hypothetical protein HON22_02955 [Candidatus Peregrinibacteria bacterium]|jgi:hypothetical protein|nr:hypothetical protein [Candidatus Peregrinibacteria bacterium]